MPARPATSSRLADRIAATLALEVPHTRQMLGSAVDAELPEDDLPDLSPQGRAGVHELVATLGQQVSAASWVDDPVTGQVLGWLLDVGIPGFLPGRQGAELDPWLHDPFAGLGGPALGYHQLMSAMPVHTTAQALSYLARLAGAGRYLDGVIATAHQRDSLALRSAAVDISSTVHDADNLCRQQPHATRLVTSFQSRLEAAGLADSDLLDRATELVRDTVQPAFARLADCGRAALPTARADGGLCHLPDGDRAYGYAVRAHTTTDLTPEQVHQLGLDEVDRLHELIRERFHHLGHAGNDVAELYRQLGRRDDLRYPTGDTLAVLDDVHACLTAVTAAVRPHFADWPSGDCAIEVIPTDLHGIVPSHLRPPAGDGSPATFMLNPLNALAGTRHESQVLTFHEAVPGHALQIGLSLASTAVPAIRRLLPFTAYLEGWAKYAETLPGELAGWDDLPGAGTTALRAVLHRHAVADTGFNLHGWDSARVAAYCADATGDETTLPTMVPARCRSMPGQLLGYKIGMLEILRIRDAACAALGPGFTPAAYHDAVLRNGALPLILLQNVTLASMRAGA